MNYVYSREAHGSGDHGSFEPGDAYYEAGGAVSKKRAIEAGYRLAKTLDELLAP